MKRINFNSGWEFSLNGGEKERIDLPHDFSITRERKADAPCGKAGGFFQGGFGVYEKSFEVKKNKKYLFMCDGSFGITEVVLNENLLFINKYPYNSFFVDLTEHLRYDKPNLLRVKVNNTHQPNARWYTGSGIYRDTFLCEYDDTYIHPFGQYAYTKSIENDCAYMAIELPYTVSKNGEGVAEFDVFEAGKKKPVYSFKKYFYAQAGSNNLSATFELDNPKVWDIDSPNMYELRAKITVNGTSDTHTCEFGVRTINLHSKKGFLLNGKSVKLRGGCVHHDHGPIGAKVYKEAEFRRVARLKAAGFNSIRLSHNPQSQYLYEACDHLGMLVIDELYDYWTDGKLDNDFHLFFEENYEKWTELIVLRNRAHPSIIMWSTGNEIPQKAGRGNGYFYATSIANNIRKYDNSRPLTHALCSLWDCDEMFEKENATKELPASEMDYFAKMTSITADTVDIIGYNYLEYRIEKDLERFPQRLIINTETFPQNAYSTIKQLLNNDRIVGDFVWTAWDYFGETGIGRVDYGEAIDCIILAEHPHHIANCGDIDICGNRRPQSYYREISWELTKDPYIAVRHPKLHEKKHFPSAWGFYECEHTWCFEGYEGKETEAYVFADCDEVLVEVNGSEVARMPRSENGIYELVTEYQPGTITAYALVDGKVVGKSSITTEGKAEKIILKPEKSHITKTAKAPSDDIIYVDTIIADKDGQICTQDERNVKYELSGAEIVGIGNANLTTTELYVTNEHTVFKGISTLVLKRTGNEKITLTAKAQDVCSATINL